MKSFIQSCFFMLMLMSSGRASLEVEYIKGVRQSKNVKTVKHLGLKLGMVMRGIK